MKKLSFSFISVLIIFSACNNAQISSEHPPIVLGDSSTIVTETDSLYLKNNFLDIELSSSSTTKTTAQNLPSSNTNVDTISNQQNTAQQQASSGYTILVEGEQIVLQGLEGKIRQGNGHNYVMPLHLFPQKIILQKNSKILSIQQKVSTRLYATSKYGKLELSSLGSYATDWKTLAVEPNGNAYTVPSINNIGFKPLNNAELRKGIENTISKASLKSKDKQTWTSELQNVKSTKDAKIETNIYKVDWKINTGNKSTIITFTF